MPALIKADGGALACPRVVTIDKTADPGTVVHSVMAYDEVGRDGVAHTDWDSSEALRSNRRARRGRSR